MHAAAYLTNRSPGKDWGCSVLWQTVQSRLQHAAQSVDLDRTSSYVIRPSTRHTKRYQPTCRRPHSRFERKMPGLHFLQHSVAQLEFCRLQRKTGGPIFTSKIPCSKNASVSGDSHGAASSGTVALRAFSNSVHCCKGSSSLGDFRNRWHITNHAVAEGVGHPFKSVAMPNVTKGACEKRTLNPKV